MKTIRILLVDDSEHFLRSAKGLLACDPRMTVVGSASDGLSGVELAKSLAPDLVLMDLSMPVLGGLEATRRIKDSTPAPRVVILTLHDSQEYRRSAYESGADGFVSKSGLTAALPALVEALFPGMERCSGVRIAGENEHE